MNLNNFIYSYLLKLKLNQFLKNADLIISNLDKIERQCSYAIRLNDNTDYNKSILNLKENIIKEKNKINNEILKEL